MKNKESFYNLDCLKKFRCVEDPNLLYEANKELFGDYDEF